MQLSYSESSGSCLPIQLTQVHLHAVSPSSISRNLLSLLVHCLFRKYQNTQISRNLQPVIRHTDAVSCWEKQATLAESEAMT